MSHVPITEMSELVRSASNRFGERCFIRPAEPEMPAVSFADLELFTHRFRRLLQESGVNEGERIAVVLHNSSLLSLLFIATIAARRVLVPINPKSSPTELAHIFGQTTPKIVLCEPELASGVAAQLDGVPVTAIEDVVAYYRAVQAMPIGAPLPAASGSESARDAEVVYTSGSTGRAKGVVLSHACLLANSRAIAEVFELDTATRMLTVCPLFHNSGQIITTLPTLWSGASTTAVRSDIGMLSFWHWVERFDVHWTMVMNAFLAALLQRKDRPGALSLEGIISGGSKLDPALIEKFEARFGVPVHQCYGMTETTSIAVVERPRVARARGSAGPAVPGCEVAIEVDGRLAPAGTAGEVVIRGTNVMSRYLAQPELSATILRGGWLHSGDLGVIDERGNLSIVDRLDNMLIVGGENIYPAEIEQWVHELPGIADGVVVGVPDDILGTQLAFVYQPAASEPPSIEALVAMLRQRVSAFKVPRRWVAVSELGLTEIPRAPNGKALRAVVKRALLQHLSAQAA